MRFLLSKLRISTPLFTCLAATLLSTAVFADETQNGNQQSTWLLAQTDEQGDRIAAQEVTQPVVVEPTVQPVQSYEPIAHSKPIKHKPHHKNKARIQTARPHKQLKPIKHKKQYRHTKNSDEITSAYWVYPSQRPAVSRSSTKVNATTTLPRASSAASVRLKPKSRHGRSCNSPGISCIID